MITLGYQGMVVYARAFFDDPQATMSADMFLALLKGPGAVPVVLCLMAIFAGLLFVGNAIEHFAHQLYWMVAF